MAVNNGNTIVGYFNQQANRDPRNLNTYISPVQLQRMRHDVQMWRDGTQEAENAYYPHRVRMQRLFLDTKLNGHVLSVTERRKDLTLLRDFEIQDENGKRLEDLEKIFTKEWFSSFVNYTLDALFFGYSLISLGDIENDEFKNISIVRRWNISPDRKQVTTLIYSLIGTPFLEGEPADWHVWVKTPTDTGQSDCGYGLYYPIAIYEIFLRNTLGYNGDFVELYAQPYRVGKTTKTEESERAELEAALQKMGSNGYALIDTNDTIEFLETALGGTGWKGYENLEMRCEKKISKILLGHEDAVSSTPGKLGSTNGEDNPVFAALRDKQTKDGKFVENIVNGQLIPKLIKLGFNIPTGAKLVYSNSAETEAVENNENARNKDVAEIAVSMNSAGLKMDAKYFTERTGIPATEIEDAIPAGPAAVIPGMNKGLSTSVKNKLKETYK